MLDVNPTRARNVKKSKIYADVFSLENILTSYGMFNPNSTISPSNMTIFSSNSYIYFNKVTVEDNIIQ